MKKIILIIVVLLSTAVANSQKKNASFFAGYSTQGFVIRGDFKISDNFIKGGETFIYLEGGLDQQKFAKENFKFENQNYPSDTRILFAGIGIAQEFVKNKFSIVPYLGLRYAYARFKDKALVSGIGQQNLIRYWNGQKVGPTIENGYGDTFTFDAGLRLGFHISKSLELVASGSISPVKFSTAATVYGKYWGESPYPNDYYIKYEIWRAEGGLRLHF